MFFAKIFSFLIFRFSQKLSYATRGRMVAWFSEPNKYINDITFIPIA